MMVQGSRSGPAGLSRRERSVVRGKVTAQRGLPFRRSSVPVQETAPTQASGESGVQVTPSGEPESAELASGQARPDLDAPHRLEATRA